MIGIFDSGLGGLAVVKSIMDVLPQLQITYLGDTARLPYGNRSLETVYSFTQEGVDFLFKAGCTLVILACNTASAEALRKIQQEYLPKNHPDKRVLGIIRPLVEEAARVTKNKRIGIIATRGTVSSGAYVRELNSQNSEIRVFQNPSPLLIPLIEEGWMKRQETKKIIKYYLRPLMAKNIDTLILGCTHFQMIHSLIRDMVGKKCNVLNSGNIIAQSFVLYLKKHPEIEKILAKGKSHRFFVTDITQGFQDNANRYLGRSIHLEKISLPDCPKTAKLGFLSS